LIDQLIKETAKRANKPEEEIYQEMVDNCKPCCLLLDVGVASSHDIYALHQFKILAIKVKEDLNYVQ
jgi:hypothetical protein